MLAELPRHHNDPFDHMLVAQAMTERLGLDLQVIDIGWPAMSSISWAWAAAGLMIPIGLVINFVMLTLKLTKTMNVDIWNYWQFAFVGYAVTTVSGSADGNYCSQCTFHSGSDPCRLYPAFCGKVLRYAGHFISASDGTWISAAGRAFKLAD